MDLKKPEYVTLFRKLERPEGAWLGLRLLPLFGHDCDPTNAVSAREAPMPKAIRPAATPPAVRRVSARKPKVSPERVAEIFARFAAANPEPKGELEYINHYTLLVAVVLSAQATDAGVNKATCALFKAADTPKKMVALGEAEVQARIKTIGLFRMKAKNVIALSQKLIAQHGGEVPREREALECYRRAVDLSPEQVDALIAAAMVANRLHEHDQANAWFQRVIELDDQCEAAHVGLIESRLCEGLHDDAETVFYMAQNALTEPSARCFAAMAESLIQRQVWERAQWCLKEALRLEPAMPRLRSRLAAVLTATGKRQRTGPTLR